MCVCVRERESRGGGGGGCLSSPHRMNKTQVQKKTVRAESIHDGKRHWMAPSLREILSANACGVDSTVL